MLGGLTQTCFSTTLAEKLQTSAWCLWKRLVGVAVKNRGGDNMGIAWVCSRR